MELREFFSEDAIQLSLQGTTKDDILKELIALLKLDEKSDGMLFVKVSNELAELVGSLDRPPPRSTRYSSTSA